MADKLNLHGLFYPALAADIASRQFYLRKLEADGKKIKPAWLFYPVLPLASPTRQFCSHKTESRWPRNKICTVIFLPSSLDVHYSLVLLSQNRKRTAARNKTCMAYFLSSSICVPHSPVLPPQNRKRTAGKLNLHGLFYTVFHLRPPLASFAPAKSEADGRKIKPALPIFSRRPFASPSRQFCPRKTGSGRPIN